MSSRSANETTNYFIRQAFDTLGLDETMRTVLLTPGPLTTSAATRRAMLDHLVGGGTLESFGRG